MDDELTRMLRLNLADIVLMKGPTKEKLEFWIVPLFLFGHLFELGTISSDELGQLHYDIAKL